jgi:hypothetical protein
MDRGDILQYYLCGRANVRWHWANGCLRLPPEPVGDLAEVDLLRRQHMAHSVVES